MMISYIAYAADSQIRYEATSGGVGSAIIKYLFDNQIIQTSITFDYDCNSLQYVPRLIYSYDEYRNPKLRKRITWGILKMFAPLL